MKIIYDMYHHLCIHSLTYSHKIIHMLYLLYCLLRHRVYVYLRQLLTTPVYHLSLYLIANFFLFQPLNSPILLHLPDLRLFLSIIIRFLRRIVHLL